MINLFLENLNSDIFDVLVFANRNLERCTIPSFIKIIGQNTFQYSTKLQFVEFLQDSKLEIIEENAFSNTPINNISIPSSVTQIKQYAFSYCNCLKNIELPNNYSYKTIEKKHILHNFNRKNNNTFKHY